MGAMFLPTVLIAAQALELGFIEKPVTIRDPFNIIWDIRRFYDSFFVKKRLIVAKNNSYGFYMNSV